MERLELHQTFYDYCEEKRKHDIHPNITKTNGSGDKEKRQTKHMLYYGAKGIGKYSQVLLNIQDFSQSNLKYERKLIVNYDKADYLVMMSDIHFEIDMELLGCNSKTLFHTIMKHIEDIVETRIGRIGIVVCKNFHLVHNELLDIFYSYMSRMSHISKIVFHIISEHVSFIPDNIIDACHIVQMGQPTKVAVSKITTNGNVNTKKNVGTIRNLRALNEETSIITLESKIENSIIEYIIDIDDFNMSRFRELIYDMLVYNIDVHECIGNIITTLVKRKYISHDKYYDVFVYVYQALKQYNNNYRPIYHLENIYYYLITTIHEEKFHHT